MSRPGEREFLAEYRSADFPPFAVVSVNDDVMESDRHAISMRGHAGLYPAPCRPVRPQKESRAASDVTAQEEA
jgi:hypothetical protein